MPGPGSGRARGVCLAVAANTVGFRRAHVCRLWPASILPLRSSGCRLSRAGGLTLGTLAERFFVWLGRQSSFRAAYSLITVMQLCVADKHIALLSRRMSVFVRSFILLVVLGGMLIFTSLGPVAAQVAALQAAAATPCCPDDCPPKVDCGPACAALMQCRSAPVTMVLEIGFRQSADTYGAMKFTLADAASDYSVLQTGLRRPPRL